MVGGAGDAVSLVLDGRRVLVGRGWVAGEVVDGVWAEGLAEGKGALGVGAAVAREGVVGHFFNEGVGIWWCVMLTLQFFSPVGLLTTYLGGRDFLLGSVMG